MKTIGQLSEGFHNIMYYSFKTFLFLLSCIISLSCIIRNCFSSLTVMFLSLTNFIHMQYIRTYIQTLKQPKFHMISAPQCIFRSHASARKIAMKYHFGSSTFCHMYYTNGLKLITVRIVICSVKKFVLKY